MNEEYLKKQYLNEVMTNYVRAKHDAEQTTFDAVNKLITLWELSDKDKCIQTVKTKDDVYENGFNGLYYDDHATYTFAGVKLEENETTGDYDFYVLLFDMDKNEIVEVDDHDLWNVEPEMFVHELIIETIAEHLGYDFDDDDI